MLRLSEFVTCRKIYCNQSGGGGYISALEHCRKIKFGIYVQQTLINTNCEQYLGHFMICNAFSNIPCEGSISQIWNTVGR